MCQNILKQLFIFFIVSLICCGCNNNESTADPVSISARNFRMPLDNSRLIRSDIEVELLVENTGAAPITYDTLLGEFYLQDSKACQEQRKLNEPVTIASGKSRVELVKGNFGLFESHQVGREIMVSLLHKGQVVYGPFSILVPVDLKP